MWSGWHFEKSWVIEDVKRERREDSALYKDLTFMHKDIIIMTNIKSKVMNKSHRYSEEGNLIVGIS